jgi:hypothetical protein
MILYYLGLNGVKNLKKLQHSVSLIIKNLNFSIRITNSLVVLFLSTYIIIIIIILLLLLLLDRRFQNYIHIYTYINANLFLIS